MATAPPPPLLLPGPHRRVSTSRQRHFLQSFLSSRITDRERLRESEQQHVQGRRIEDLSRHATGATALTPQRAPATPEEAFSAEALAARKRGRQEFYDSIFLYLERYGRARRGHVEFIEASLKRMRDLGVHEDLEAYKALMDIFPKDLMRVRTMWQSEFKHYPRHQDTAMGLLDKMNEHGVMPDTDLGLQISRTFGTESYVMAKFERMMYWMPKLRHADPWPVGRLTSSGLRYQPEPDSAKQLAVCALRRMCPDRLTRVAAYDMEGAGQPFVASAQSPAQHELLAQLPQGAAVYLDGPSRVWFGKYRLGYYVLSADPTPLAREHAARAQAEAAASVGKPEVPLPRPDQEDFSWWRRMRCPGVDDDDDYDHDDGSAASGGALVRAPCEHELADATILALAIPSSAGAADLLLRWIRLLASEAGNEPLHRLNVVFRIRPSNDDSSEADGSAAAARQERLEAGGN